MPQYPIIGTQNDLWMINPENKHRIKLLHTDTKILDMYISNEGIYHAIENVITNTKVVRLNRHKKVEKEYDYNFVEVYDSIAQKILRRVYPEGQNIRHFTDRLFELEFSFIRENDKIKAKLNNSISDLGLLVEEARNPGNLLIDDKRIYFNGKRIMISEEDVIYSGVVEFESFRKMCRKKNRTTLHKLKSLID